MFTNVERRYYKRIKLWGGFWRMNWALVDGEVMAMFAKGEKHKRVCYVNKIGIEAAFWGGVSWGQK